MVSPPSRAPAGWPQRVRASHPVRREAVDEKSCEFLGRRVADPLERTRFRKMVWLRARHNVCGSHRIRNAARLAPSMRWARPDLLQETSTPTTPPRPDAQSIDVIQQLMSLLSHNTPTAFATHMSLLSLDRRSGC